jgi:hypothetical protein
MPFEYKELTRRQLLDQVTESAPENMSQAERMKYQSLSKNHAGNITSALNLLGSDSWELIDVTEIDDSGGEILYVFKKTI